jgi:glutamyl/glutaminyl-tRNA synthetase
MGILKQALVNYLGILGRNVKNELMEEEELVRTFYLGSLSSSDSIFDVGKLLWFNKEYMRKIPVDNLLLGLGLSIDYKDRILLLRENAKTLKEMKELFDIFDGTDIEDGGVNYLSQVEGWDSIVAPLKAILASNGDILFDDILQGVEGNTNLKKKELLMVLRILCTGRKSGPPLKEIFQFIPKDIIMKRIECLQQRFSLL